MKLTRDEDGNIENRCNNCSNYDYKVRRCSAYIGHIIIRECINCRNFVEKYE